MTIRSFKSGISRHHSSLLPPLRAGLCGSFRPCPGTFTRHGVGQIIPVASWALLFLPAERLVKAARPACMILALHAMIGIAGRCCRGSANSWCPARDGATPSTRWCKAAWRARSYVSRDRANPTLHENLPNVHARNFSRQQNVSYIEPEMLSVRKASILFLCKQKQIATSIYVRGNVLSKLRIGRTK